MSSLYATEPATAGRVIFETTHGPLDILLWCHDCPLTTRFFLQLCLDGFYDNMLFHRIVPSLLIQTGAIRGSHHGQVLRTATDSSTMTKYRSVVHADEALERRQYEVNPRIRFNHRGQVAMALGVSDMDDTEDLQPQFFITTEDAPYLDGKHVVFGTLGVGPTMFNAIRIVQGEVDETTNTPVDLENAPRIVSTKIVENPIHQDIVPQLSVPWRPVVAEPKKKKKRKGKLDVNVLSFGDEMGEAETTGTAIREEVFKGSRKTSRVAMTTEPKRIRNKEKEVEHHAVVDAPPTTKVETSGKNDNTDSDTLVLLPLQEGESLKLKSNQKQGSIDGDRPSDVKATVSLVDARRAKYAKGSKSKQEREEETMAKLLAFRGKVHNTVAPDVDVTATRDDSLASRMARRAQQELELGMDNADTGEAYAGQVLESDGEGEGTTWLRTKFKCRKHMDHLAGDGRDVDDYVLLDEKRKDRSRF